MDCDSDDMLPLIAADALDAQDAVPPDFRDTGEYDAALWEGAGYHRMLQCASRLIASTSMLQASH